MPNHQKKPANRIRDRDFWGIIATFRAGIGAGIPLGYEDERGFHYGMAPIPSILGSLVDNQYVQLLKRSGF